MLSLLLRSCVASILLGQVIGHTWVDQLQVIDQNGSYVGDYGYPRAYVAHTDPGFNGDSDNYLLPPLKSGRTRIDGTDLLCHPSQRTSKYTDQYPQLKAAPGNFVAMKYLENGHVTLPKNQKGKPEAGGTVFVFGTTQPKDDEKLADVLQWTSDGNGGDKRGKLLTAQNFDDGRCYQLNPSGISADRQKQFPNPIAGQKGTNAEQWCETDLQIPQDTQAGTLTVYWVWQWPTAPGADPGLPTGKDEYYTTCSDMQIVGDTSVAQLVKAKAVHTLVQQDPQTAAVASFQSRTALTTNPLAGQPSGSSGSATPSASGPSTPSSGTGSSAATSSAAASSAADASSSSHKHRGRPTAAPTGDAPPQASGAPVVPVVVTQRITVTVKRRSEPTEAVGNLDAHKLKKRMGRSAKFRSVE